MRLYCCFPTEEKEKTPKSSKQSSKRHSANHQEQLDQVSFKIIEIIKIPPPIMFEHVQTDLFQVYIFITYFHIFLQFNDDDNTMEFLEEQQNTESGEWTVDTKACELMKMKNNSIKPIRFVNVLIVSVVNVQCFEGIDYEIVNV